MSPRGAAAVPFALDVLARGENLWVREASPSMLPLIRPGDELLLVPLEFRKIRAGALIAFRRGDALVVHRVLAADADGVVAKGDALASPDPLVVWDQVVARVVALRAADGRLVNLDAFPWPLVNPLLGWIASLAGRLGLESHAEARAGLVKRLVWKALRLPFYFARLVLR